MTTAPVSILCESILLLSLPVVACFIFYSLSPTGRGRHTSQLSDNGCLVSNVAACGLFFFLYASLIDCCFVFISSHQANRSLTFCPVSQGEQSLCGWSHRCFDFWLDAVSGVSAVIIILLFSPSGYLTHPSFVFIPSHQQTGGNSFAIHWLIKLIQVIGMLNCVSAPP